MTKVVSYAMRGLGYGGVAYLLLIASHLEKWPTRSSTIFSILAMSAAIGILTLIFDSERLSFLGALGLHFVGTLVLVLAMLAYNHWLTQVATTQAIWSFGWSFVLIYIGIYGVVRFNQHLRVTKINRALSQRQR